MARYEQQDDREGNPQARSADADRVSRHGGAQGRREGLLDPDRRRLGSRGRRGLTLQLDLVPVDGGRIVLRAPKPAEGEGTQGEGA